METNTLNQNQWIRICLFLMSFLLLAGINVSADEKMSDKTVQVKLLKPFGTLDHVYQIGNLYFAAQPDKTTLKHFKNLGGKTVINLRDPSELKFNERLMAHDLGLRYYNFPVTGKQPINPSIMLAVSWAIEQEGNEPIFIHCSSGNRAAVALGAHFTRKLGLTQDEAVAVAGRSGLTNPGSRQKLIALLKRGLRP